MTRPLSILLIELEGIYKQIPSFECKPGCSECCGPIVWSVIEEINIRRYLNKHHMKHELKKFDITNPGCPYVENNRCRIYPVRPLICRCFGVVTHPLMRCQFVRAEKTISNEQMRKYQNHIQLLSQEVPQGIVDRLTKWREKHKPH